MLDDTAFILNKINDTLKELNTNILRIADHKEENDSKDIKISNLRAEIEDLEVEAINMKEKLRNRPR